MATYEIQTPDGAVYEIDAADDAQLQATIAQLTGKIGYSASSPRDRYDAKYGALDPLDRPPMLPGEMTPEEAAPSPPPTSGIRKFIEQLNVANDRVFSAPNRNIGTLESLGSMASGAVALPVASVVGIGTEAARGLGLTGARGEDIAERVQQAITYQPRTESGRAQSEYLGTLTEPLAESGVDIALLPLAPELQGLSAVRRVPRVEPEPIPTTAQLKKAKTDAYAAAKEVDASVPAEAYSEALGKVRSIAQEQGLDPTLHPKSTAVMRRLVEAEGKPLTLQEAETLRKIALDAEDDLNPVTRSPTPDARIAGMIVDELDDTIEALSVNSPARALNARFRRSDMIDRMIRRAEIKAGSHYTQAGMEHALRQEFKQLALNDRRMRYFTPEQREAIERVAKGGLIENALRSLGKFDPISGGMSAFIGTGTGGAIGGAIGGAAGGGIGALTLPVAGFLAKRGATKLTARNVDLAREALVGRGLPKAPTAEELGASLRDAGMVQPLTGELQPRAPLALPAPSIISSPRSAPGTAFAREEMGLTPDVERAGAFHPGVARESLVPSRTAMPHRAPQPDYPAALPHRPAPGLLSDQRPMVVDSQGRVARMREQIDAHLKELGMDRMRNVRQPRAEPMPRGLLADDLPQEGLLGVNPVEEIRQALQKLDKKLQRLPVDEPIDSPRMKKLAAEWERLQAELSRAESRDVGQ